VTAALSFLISAVVVYFVLVLPVSRLLQLLERNRLPPRGTALSAHEHPGRGAAPPGGHGRDHAGHRAAAAGRLARVRFPALELLHTGAGGMVTTSSPCFG
jgi:hypothetical protein